MVTKVGGLEFSLAANSASFENGVDRARKSMRGLASDVSRDVSKIERSLSSATAAVASFGKGLVIGAASAAGVAGVTAVFTKLITEVREAEDSQVRLSAVLKATGYTAGLTAKQLTSFADALENSTIQTAESIKDASAILATFKSVSGEVFTDAIRRAADLSAVFKQDLSASATQLGKALQEPVEGLAALRRVGVSFTDAQKEVIEKLVETGQVAEAQKVILKTLADQVGGAAEAQRSGTLTGAFFGAADAIGDMLKRWDEITGTAPAVEAALRAVQSAANSAFAVPDTASSIEAQRQKIASLRVQLDRERDGLFRGPAEQQVFLNLQAAEKELAYLEEKLRRETQIESAQQQRAKSAATVAQAEVNAANKASAAEEKAKKDVVAATKAASAEKQRIADKEREWQETFNMVLAQEEAILKANGVAAKVEADAAMKRIEAQFEAKEKVRKAEEDAAKEEADRRQAIVDEFNSRVQNSLADAIRGGLEDGFSDPSALLDNFGDLLKSTVAESLAAGIMEQVNIGALLGTKISDLAPSLAGTRAGNATVGGAAASGLGAAFGGYAVGQQFEGNRLYGTLGGVAAGAAAGAPLGPYGAAAGAVIGGVAGFFGSGSTGGTRNNNFHGGFDPLTGELVEFQNTNPDPANQNVVAGVIGQLAVLRDGLKALGLGIGAGEFTVQAGNKTGLTLNGQQYGSASALTEAALRQLLAGATGLSADQQTVLGTSKAKDAAGLLADLSIPEQLANLRAPLGEFAAGMKELGRVFEAANDNAVRLGLSRSGLAQAQAQQEEQLRDTYKAQLGLIDPLTAAINQVNAAFAEAIRNADALGVSELELRRERNRQIEALKEQARAAFDAQRAGIAGQVQSTFGFLPGLQNFDNDNAISGLSGGTKLDQFRAAKAEFERTKRLAETGDQEALGQITGLGQQVLTLGRDVFASSPAFANLEAQVSGSIGSLAETFGQLQKDNFAELMADNKANVFQQTQTLVTELRELKKAIEKAGFGNAYRARAA